VVYGGEDGGPSTRPWIVDVLEEALRSLRWRGQPGAGHPIGTSLLTRPSDPTGERPVGDAVVITSQPSG